LGVLALCFLRKGAFKNPASRQGFRQHRQLKDLRNDTPEERKEATIERNVRRATQLDGELTARPEAVRGGNPTRRSLTKEESDNPVRDHVLEEEKRANSAARGSRG